MYYEPGKIPHGLAFDLFKSCVVPRPIGWIGARMGWCLPGSLEKLSVPSLKSRTPCRCLPVVR